MKRIKTGFLERRLELAKASLITGSKILGHSAANMLTPPEERKQKNKAMMAEQAMLFVTELGKLKGSVVKIGQMLALYGEYFLPKEITDALHSLEDDTGALDWSAMEPIVLQEFGKEKFSQLNIDPKPLAAASLGQVHRATRVSDGQQLCIKIQYPDVDKSIHSDLNAIIQLLKVGRFITSKSVFESWFKEAQAMLYQEIDYIHEARKTQFVGRMLEDDSRYIVPEVFSKYSTKRILTTSYVPGLNITDPKVAKLPLRRRTQLAQSALDIFLIELFEWGEMQTDPNFGNYRIHLGNSKQPDRLILLDFGAMKTFSPEFLRPFRNMIKAAYNGDKETFLQEAIALEFMQEGYPDDVLKNFVDIAIEIIEPLAAHHNNTPDYALNKKGEYCWYESKLPKRVAKKASQASMSKYFVLPPKEFMFMNRKLMGVYTFILELRAQFNGGVYLEKHLHNLKD